MKKLYHKYKKKNNNKRNLEAIILKRYNILTVTVVILNLILLISLYSIQVVNSALYIEKKENLSKQLVEGSTAPRGRIYDRNNKIIVDNTPIKTIRYYYFRRS